MRTPNRLQRGGLVDRQRSADDGRAVCVSLTAAGRDLIERVTTVRRTEIAAILDWMPPAHHDDLVAALRAFGEAAGELSDKDGPYTCPSTCLSSHLSHAETVAVQARARRLPQVKAPPYGRRM